MFEGFPPLVMACVRLTFLRNQSLLSSPPGRIDAKKEG